MEATDGQPGSMSSYRKSAAAAREYLHRGDVAFWHITTFRCAAQFGRYRGIAELWPAARPVVYGFTALINLCLVLWFGPQRCKSRNAHLRDFLEQQFHIFLTN